MADHPSDPQGTLDPVAIREALAGYAAANDVAEAERGEQLARMTDAEALAIWHDLADSYNGRPELHENLDRLDLWQVEGLLTIRRALDRLADRQSTS